MEDLSAGWIWFETDETQDIFARARRKFSLESVTDEAILRITCSGHYRLYVKADIPQNAEVEFLVPSGFEGRTDYDRST